MKLDEMEKMLNDSQQELIDVIGGPGSSKRDQDLGTMDKLKTQLEDKNMEYRTAKVELDGLRDAYKDLKMYFFDSKFQKIDTKLEKKIRKRKSLHRRTWSQRISDMNSK